MFPEGFTLDQWLDWTGLSWSLNGIAAPPGSQAKKWEEVAKQHRQETQAKLEADAAVLKPQWEQISDDMKRKVLGSDATALLEAMQAGELTSEIITLVYTERAYHIGSLQINAVTEGFLADAVESARASDQRRARANGHQCCFRGGGA